MPSKTSPHLVPSPLPARPETEQPERIPPGASAARLVQLFEEDQELGLIHVAGSENEAEETARAFQCFQPDAEVLVMPPWDCLPYDRTPPQRNCMGRRMEVLAALDREPLKRRLVVTSPEALLQGLPPSAVTLSARFVIASGEPLDRDELTSFLHRTGYVLDDRVDEAGEAALLGDVIDIFPAAATAPVRILLGADDVVEDIRIYDPATQRTDASINRIEFGAASELVAEAGRALEDLPAGQTMEARLSVHYGELERLLDRLPAVRVSMAVNAERRAEYVLDLIDDARAARQEFSGESTRAGDAYYLERAAWRKALKRRQPRMLAVDGVEAGPRFFLEAQPRRAVGRFLEEQAQSGMRILLTGAESEGARLSRMATKFLSNEPGRAETWQHFLGTGNGSVLAAHFDLGRGFLDKAQQLAVIAAADVFGERLHEGEATAADALLAEPELRVGDVVIHEDHGVGILRALETVTVEGVELDAVRLEYHGGASLLAPVAEFGHIWRYGGEAEAVTLDRLHTDAWLKRRSEISAEIDQAAANLIAAAKIRAEEHVEPIVPPRKDYARSAARFPYPETADQAAAIDAVLADLASGKVMNRLVCGDVGFGKTEIALRAAAAAAFSGKQVAVVAPTTVLVRQHFETFQRRFTGTGMTVGHLSRVTAGSEMEATKEGLRSGGIRIVVATQAIASKDVAFQNLALLIIDEEHRFGAKLKDSLRALAPRVHTLTMSATPIPRTLQSAMVGVQDVSVLASPPARRRPIRTFLMPYDPAAVKTALVRENRRGGQSFVVAPHIEDLEELESTLQRLVPDLVLRVAHGKMDPKAMDEVMVEFAAGAGDILLSTNIIESGLDVPRANTMIVWRSDRFGLAQLHQLRGRVGRGRAQGIAYLLTEADKEVPEATRSRLSTLVAFDRLGSGLAISARDLDLRGAGDLMGEEQAGHMKLIGVSLYQRLLASAVEAARGKADKHEWEAELNLGMSGSFPSTYVPEATVRLNLYARLLRLTRVEDIEAFADEVADRFGEPPESVATLIALIRLKIEAHDQGIQKIDAGPLALALDFRKPPAEPFWKRMLKKEGISRREDRLIWARRTEPDAERLKAVAALVKAVAKPAPKPKRKAAVSA